MSILNKDLNKEKITDFALRHSQMTQSNNIYNDAKDWVYDQYHSHSVWLKRWIIVSIVLSIFLLISITTNLLLLPLKQKVPYLYAFNNATGEITQLGKLEPYQFSSNWQMTRYFIMHYVINRESYDSDNIDYPYQIAWAMSTDNVRQQYDTEVDSSIATSPYRMYGKDKYVTVNVLAISQLSPDTASVRFEKTLTDRNTGTQAVSQDEAIVKWNYENNEVDQKILDRDPLGFKVTYYQVTPVNLGSQF